MLETIRKAWKWAGLNPVEILQVNAFGNLSVKAVDESIWRIRSEELNCEEIASDFGSFEKLQREEKFRVDWEMARLVALAEKKLGPNYTRPLLLFQIVSGLWRKIRFGQLGRHFSG